MSKETDKQGSSVDKAAWLEGHTRDHKSWDAKYGSGGLGTPQNAK